MSKIFGSIDYLKYEPKCYVTNVQQSPFISKIVSTTYTVFMSGRSWAVKFLFVLNNIFNLRNLKFKIKIL